MTDIRKPRLLDAALHEIDRLTPLALHLTLQLHGLSTAVMTLPPEAPAVDVRSLIELYDENGSVGIFRVVKTERTVGGAWTLRLEHGLCTLRDGMMPAQSFMRPIGEALQAILDTQPVPLWALGTIELPQDMTLIFSTDFADGLIALQAMIDMLPEGYALDFDQSVQPWLMHVRRLDDQVDCEGRLSRNLGSVRIGLDSSSLCTRLYPFGAEVGDSRVTLEPILRRLYTETLEAEVLGVVSRTFTSDRIFDASTLYDVAALYLERHKQPDVTLTVDAFDLSEATGDEFDRFRLGKNCRLALPSHRLYLTARICTIEKADVYRQPGHAVLTLSNHQRHTRERDEIDELVRRVTAGKLLGGTVAEIVSRNYASGTYQSPVEHSFTVEDWPELLDVQAAYTPDSGVQVTALYIDGVAPPASAVNARGFSIMPYLRRDNLGRVAPGVHQLVMHPYTASGEGAVASTVTMTIIQEK